MHGMQFIFLRTTSGASKSNLRVDGFQFATSVVDFHLPVDAALFAVDIDRPCPNLIGQFLNGCDAATADALAFVLHL